MQRLPPHPGKMHDAHIGARQRRILTQFSQDRVQVKRMRMHLRTEATRLPRRARPSQDLVSSGYER